ncbi:RluA family pseudouridine synthase [Pseudemcibacter aquimaris]|uniref:RluA family pseudouridine synthase n=1 Tax=Pseudemcibacter aquimaris TaxID=2857064 RepID=UPI0020127D03|nr:RluA family pseudouridine synthase [Pseudemcibacter aquimaris]MCC3862202.1 RluA family pseudouridine synthase [Pseudemcibacter aquimaris]WDU58955.1 RluA family pseudouridine synthase [Pseudemcibacter aquimaris]
MTLNEPHIFEAVADEDDQGTRLDKFLSNKLPDISRSRLKSLIGEGQVILKESAQKMDKLSYKVKEGETFVITVPEIVDPDPIGEDIPLEVHYEDEHLIVLYKPAGMVVHPAPGNNSGTLVNALIHHCGDSLSGINGVKRPGIVHRIDKETSGLMVAAKSDKAHKGLAKQFAKHSLERAYYAICWGVPNPTADEIYAPIKRDPKNRLKMAVREGGKESLTHYRVVRRLEPPRKITSRQNVKQGLPPSLALVECRLETGRTHQVRVHMSHKGYPLVGDPLYSRRNNPQKNFSDKAKEAINGFKRQALHAYLIGFIHPITKEHLTFEREIPNDMKQLIQALEAV